MTDAAPSDPNTPTDPNLSPASPASPTLPPSHPLSSESEPKPEMTYREASWHKHIAATREAASPEPSGDAERLAAAALPHRTVAGVVFKPITSGAFIAMRKALRLSSDAGYPLDNLDELAITLYCLADSEEAFALADAGEFYKLLQASHRRLAPVPLDQMDELRDHMTSLINSFVPRDQRQKKEAGTGADS